MTLTARDRKIVLALIPLALVAAYWFLLLAPKRQEATKVQDQLTQAETERDTAVQRLNGLTAAKRSFATDYATVIYLGKSIPSSLDMPSLIVQLDRASRGTGIKFASIKTGTRDSGGNAAQAPASGSSSSSSTANSASTAPAAAGTPAGQPGAAGGQNALDSIPLDFEFDGTFFDLADFFHRMKRFVRVANNHIVIRGRLMTINSFKFETEQDKFPAIKATVSATVYLAPKEQGVSAGATPQGPAGAPSTQTASASPSPASTPPAATVIGR